MDGYIPETPPLFQDILWGDFGTALDPKFATITKAETPSKTMELGGADRTMKYSCGNHLHSNAQDNKRCETESKKELSTQEFKGTDESMALSDTKANFPTQTRARASDKNTSGINRSQKTKQQLASIHKANSKQKKLLYDCNKEDFLTHGNHAKKETLDQFMRRVGLAKKNRKFRLKNKYFCASCIKKQKESQIGFTFLNHLCKLRSLKNGKEKVEKFLKKALNTK